MLTFVPELLRMSEATKATFPKAAVTASFLLYGALPVVVDRWLPDGFVAVVGPPRDPHGADPLDRLPQIVMLDLHEKVS